MFMIEANAINASVQREARLVGGGSAINVGRLGPARLVDWERFRGRNGRKRLDQAGV